jgi:GNAT superfamily N-acetyltransferase
VTHRDDERQPSGASATLPSARRESPRTQPVIRRADPAEAPLLTELALRSKAYWGYDAAFLEACRRGELMVSAGFVGTRPVFVLEEGGQLVGFYGLRGDPPDADLAYLFVEPAAVRRGHGRRLWEHAVATAGQLGYRRLLIESDPKAEPFYRAMGATRVGEVPSTVRPGRMLPLLTLSLAGDQP